MNERTLKALAEAGAIKQVRLVAVGGRFHAEIKTATGEVQATTGRGAVKSWVTLDAAARWVRSLGLGRAVLLLERWQPGQKTLQID